MASERKTENMLEQLLKKAGFVDADFHFQGSDDADIQRLLPSKKTGAAGKGRPEHIIRLNGDAADLLVTECKADSAHHSSSEHLSETSSLKAAKFAEDGVIHYMKGLRSEYNVIGLAVSGTSTLKITVFKALRQGAIERLNLSSVISKNDYLALLKQSASYGLRSEYDLDIFAKKLHEFLRDKMELSEAYKPLIVSGILLALKSQSFENSYRSTASKEELAENLVTAIRRTLKANSIGPDKIDAMMPGYSFIQTNAAVKMHLMTTISMIYRDLFSALPPNSSLDVLGNFYGEFLRYSGGDQQGLGIVLTPRHITELFSDLADLHPEESVVLDTCTGTGGFLISAMSNMIDKANGDSKIVRRIKNEGLVGMELDPNMFTLACGNMIFRGDGKANMFLDDCLAPREEATMKKLASLKPNVALLNPPYSKKDKDKHELAFILRALELLQKGGICIAIIPVGCLIDESKNVATLKERLLEKHTLKAVMSMPPQLFPGVGTVTAIVVFEAHKPHYRYEHKKQLTPEGKVIFDSNGNPIVDQMAIPKADSWFGYWRDDGFVLNKGKRNERAPGVWSDTKHKWLDAYRNQRECPGFSCKKAVTHLDEWIAEAYLVTDYSTLTKNDFERDLKRFALYNLMLDSQEADSEGNENAS